MKKAQRNNYPPALKVIQIINYIAVITGILLALAYLFASKDFLMEINYGAEPLNRYIVASGYLAISAAAGFVLYKFRQRDVYAPEIYVLANVLGFGIYEIIYHFSAYDVPLFEYVTVYAVETVIMTYLLLNSNVKTYFAKQLQSKLRK